MFGTAPVIKHDPRHQFDAAGFLFWPQEYVSIFDGKDTMAWTIFRKRKMDDTAYVRIGEYMNTENPIQYHIKLSVYRDWERYQAVCILHGVEPIEQDRWAEHLDMVEKFYPNFEAVA